MTATPQRARHRAARRPLTPLDDLAGNLATVGRRSAVVAASSGLVMTMALPASAAPADNAPAKALPAVDVSALTAEARAALATAPAVSVPADAAWEFSAPQIQITANPEPEPEPEPEPAPRRTEGTSRSAERAAAPAEAQAAEAPAPAPAVDVAVSGVGAAAVEIAMRYIGVPYVYGGASPSGFDCSGFTSYVYAQLGVSLPRSSADQRYAGTVVPADQRAPGDLIWTPGHIGIYAGNGMQVDAPRPGKTIQLRSIWQSNPIYIRVA